MMIEISTPVSRHGFRVRFCGGLDGSALNLRRGWMRGKRAV
jgi:hypothetical protein